MRRYGKLCPAMQLIELWEGPLRVGNAVGDGEDGVVVVVDRVLPAGE